MKTAKTLMLSVSFVALACSAIAQSWLTNGLVAYYPFNGNANDVTGNGNHGQIYGNVVAANDRFGNTASAYHFDGSFATIYVSNTVFNLGQPAYAFSGWFCSDDVTKIDQIVINTAPGAGIGLSLNGNLGQTYLDYSIGPGPAYWTVLAAHGSKNDYTNQVWYHVAFIKSGTNYVVYVNGQINDARTVPQAASYNYNVGYTIGSVNLTGGEVFKGRLDDFRVYNRALSSDEVAQLYAAESVSGYLINATSGEHGTIHPMGAVTILPGSGTNFVMTADPGFHIADVLVDGISVGPTNSWTFTDVTNGRSISVTFAINTDSWITNGLVAYYPFNGNANDVTGNGYHGKIYGNVVDANDRFGNTASAYHFDGSLASIYVSNTFLNVGQPAYTISGWFCSDDVTKIDQILFNTAPNPGFGVSLNGNGGQTYLDYSIGPGSSFWNVLSAHGSKNDYTNQVWYHVAFTKSSTNYVVYVNGQINDTRTVPQAASYDCNVSYLFGSVNLTGGEVFKGRLDDFRVYNRALSSDEVAQLYAAESVSGCLINATSGEHGTILPIGVVMILPGAGTNFVMTADPGYHIDDVLVDGISVGPTNSWTFTDVTNGRTISVTFAINTYSIHSSAGANGTILPSGVVSVEEGATTNFVVTANSGRHIAGVQVDGVPVGEFGMGSNLFQYIFHNVTSNHTISATFNTPPVVGVTASSTSGVVPLKIQFDFTTSTDAENNIIRCEVDKDGDGSIDALSETGRFVTVEYAEPGEYHATARVVDAYGAFSETNLLIKPHLNTPPVANSQTVTTTLNSATMKWSPKTGQVCKL